MRSEMTSARASASPRVSTPTLHWVCMGRDPLAECAGATAAPGSSTGQTAIQRSPLLHHVLHFVPLQADEPELVFYCDEAGHVDLDALSETERDAYLYARATMGKQYLRPRCEVCPVPAQVSPVIEPR
jgi:hypothetical protein